MIAGYDPHRIARLALHTRRAIGDLDLIASTDPAASGAIDAAHRMRRVLTTSFVPAVSGIQATQPLGAGSDWYSEWLSAQLGRIERTRYSHLDDVDLGTLLHVELTRQMEEHGAPDPDDPFWTDDLAEWVDEFERRVRIDADSAAFLVEEAADNPMVGYVVAAGNFDAGLLIAVTTALIASASGGAVHDTYRDGAIGALLTTIAERPAIALTLLGEPDMVERLLTWSDRAGGAFGLDGRTIGALFESALARPLTDPSRIEEGRGILRQLAALTHGPLFDRGLPPGTATGVTTGLIAYLPSLIGSLGLDHGVYFQDPDGMLATLLGAPDVVVDLFGALLRDAGSRAILLATIPALAIGTGIGSYGLDAVNDYVNALVEAADTEQIEEEIRARRTKGHWNEAIEFVSSALESAFEVGGRRGTIAQAVAPIVEAGARWLVEQIDAHDLGLDDVRATAFLLLVYGVSVAFLDQRRDGGDGRGTDDGDDGDPRTERARALADEIERLLAAGASHAEVERRILTLRNLVEDIGGNDAVRSLDDPRIVPPAYDATIDADFATRRDVED